MELFTCVLTIEGENFTPFEMSKFDIFRVPSNIFKHSHAGDFSEQRTANDDIKVWGIEGKRIEKYHLNDFELKEIKKKNGSVDHEDYVSKSTGFKFRNHSFFNRYKIIIPLLWGNMDKGTGIGGSYADIAIAEPKDICSYSYNVCGGSDTRDDAVRIAKYMLTKFFRALLAYNKMGKHATSETFLAIPTQDFHEDWWDESIAQIDEHLFDKYNVPDNIRTFVRNNIQTRSEDNIINL